MAPAASEVIMRKGKDSPTEVSNIRLIKDGDMEKIDLSKIRAAMPPHVFHKDALRSVAIMIWDIGVTTSLHYAMYQLWLSGNYLYMVPVCWLNGVFMASLFCIGHDCGHGSFSNHAWLNYVCGMISHSAVLAPYTAWQESHHQHHSFHNHNKKDHAFVHRHNDKLKEIYEKSSLFGKFTMAIYPVLGWHFYFIFGNPDGSHWLPGIIPGDRIWKGKSRSQIFMGWISTLGCVAFIYGITKYLFEGSIAAFFACYVPSLCVFCFIAWTITFLHHTTPDGVCYDDTTWNFVNASFQTVDRSYGWFYDFFMHRITDCHVVHHLFFTKIPHYHLREATDALVAYLEKENMSHLYQREYNPDWMFMVFRIWRQKFLKAILVTKNADLLKDPGMVGQPARG